MKIAVIDYGASNLQSVCNALKRLEESFEVVGEPERLGGFDKVILPGVGAAGQAMEQLTSVRFSQTLTGLKVPLLGICLGMQLLADFSEENKTRCLSVVPGVVRRFSSELKIPQIGWNQVEWTRPNPLMDGVPNQAYFYFVNSYYLDAPFEVTIGETLYGTKFSSVVQKENYYGVQFHPEKSGESGLRILQNFCRQC